MSRKTIDDVARLAGVSIKTVSRVVNGEPNVRAATRARVDAAIAEMNYRPDRAARNLAGRRTNLIGLVYDDPGAYELPSGGYVINIQQGVLRACKSANRDLLIHPLNYRRRGDREELNALIAHARPEGIILVAPLSNMPEIVRIIVEAGTPLIVLSPGDRCNELPAVATNDREISADMTRYLASLGHRKIAFIKGSNRHRAVASRFLGYRDGLAGSGLDYSATRVDQGDNSTLSGENCAQRLLAGKDRPTAIFAANDDMAAGVIRVANRLGIRIPEQLSVAGFDDTPLAQQVYPSLTTVRQPLEEMAERAAHLLIEFDGVDPAPPGVEIIPATLQIRDSTGAAPDAGK